MDTDIIIEPFQASQSAVAKRIDEILDACTVKDFDRLAAYHLDGPKFSKFDDGEPYDRQDGATAMRAEVRDFSALEDFDGRIEELKIDVFGPVAVATGIFRCTFRVGGEPASACTRTTVVFVDDGGDWLIAHEHHSPYPSA